MPLTRVLHVDPAHPDPKLVAEAGEALAHGALVAFPTETVYGLGANALDPSAVRRIFLAKGRPAADPLIVHVTTVDQIDPLVSAHPDALAAIARFWPGPLTVVLPRSARVPLEVTAGLESVAIRLPAHPVARALIDAASLPVAAPSANLFTRPSPTRAEHVLQDLDGRIDLLIDGGPTRHGVESTVIDLAHGAPALLRPGAVTLEQLRAALPDLRVPAPLLADATVTALPSPGTHLKHYSPRARVMVLTGDDPARVRQAVIDQIDAALSQGLKVGVMGSRQGLRMLERRPILEAALGEEGDLEAAGARLFAALRELDEAGVDLIITTGFGLEGLGRTLQDRLMRAAEGKIVRV
jgi:L-threonylcarbamoyladenylate synthase